MTVHRTRAVSLVAVLAFALTFLGGIRAALAHPSRVLVVHKLTDDGSPGTLRWSILSANLDPAPNRILVVPRGRPDLSSGRPQWVIKTDSLLPPITGPVVIEGRPAGLSPMVAVDGSNFIDTGTILSCPGEVPGTFGTNVRTLQNPGLAIVDTDNVEITGLELRSFCIGILVHRSKDNYIHRNRIVNNPGGAGLMFTGDDGAGNPTLNTTIGNRAVGNEFIDNGDGLELTRGAAFNLVKENSFISTSNNLVPSQGIEILFGSDNEVVRNTFTGYSDGIQINAGRDLGNNNRIAENLFMSNTNAVSLTGDGNIVERNLITQNRLGVAVREADVLGVLQTATRTRITENSIFDNGKDIFLCNAGGTGGTPPECDRSYPQLGIDLNTDGVTFNDDALSCADGFPDCDTGPNDLQNFPVLSPDSVWDADGVTVHGWLASRPNETYVIEIFASQEPGVVAGHGEGELFVGRTTAETDAFGNATFRVSSTSVDALGDGSTGRYFTATATDAGGNTSEFSQGVWLTGPDRSQE